MPTDPSSAVAKLNPLLGALPAKAPASIPKNTYGLFMDAAKTFMATLKKSDADAPKQKDLKDFDDAQKTLDGARTRINNAVDAQVKDLAQLKKDTDDLDHNWDPLYKTLQGKSGKDEATLLTAAGKFYQVAKQQANDVKAASKK